MRTLVVAAEYPWPVNSGSRMRLAHTVGALTGCGPTDLLSVVSGGRSDFDRPPPELGLARAERVAIDDRPPTVGRQLRSVLQSGMPLEIPLANRSAVTRRVASFATGRYDLVWCFRVRAWVLAGEPALAPVVVDLDDLEDQKIQARMALSPSTPPGVTGAARRQAGAWLSRREVRRWRRLHARIAAHSAAVVVCSEIDAQRCGLPGVRVVANGYEPPAQPVGRDTVGSPPTVLFHGTLRYPPNADAARFLVDEVRPPLQRLLPGLRIRLVGVAPPSLAPLGQAPGVTVVGRVPDVTAELGGADVVLVPLRFGSGTRIKILEAFAHRVPVVSTTIGAEGLDVADGVHLLVADDADSLARACARLLGDPALRARIVDAAHALFLARYRSSVMQDQVRAVARTAAAP